MKPSPRLVLGALVAALPLLAAPWWPAYALLALVADLVLLLVVIVDVAMTPRPRELVVEREIAHVLSAGTRNPMTLWIENRAHHALELELAEEVEEDAQFHGLEERLALASGEERSLTYHVVPRRRGRLRFRALHLRYRSRLGLLVVGERRALEAAVVVYPGVHAIRQVAMRSRQMRTGEHGAHAFRQRGREGEFERLRPYRLEDDPRDVDWKASAKCERLISREFAVERNQSVVMLLDTGRSMSNEVDGKSLLDRGLDATLALAYSTLVQGDYFSLLAFSDRLERAVGPLRGRASVSELIRQSHDLEVRPVIADYRLVCREVDRRIRKRALVVLLTHALDEHHIDAVRAMLARSSLPHLFLCVFLRDASLLELARTQPETELEAYQVAAAAAILETQARKIAALRRVGVRVLEVVPEGLGGDLVNAYLEVKSRHLL